MSNQQNIRIGPIEECMLVIIKGIGWCVLLLYGCFKIIYFLGG